VYTRDVKLYNSVRAILEQKFSEFRQKGCATNGMEKSIIMYWVLSKELLPTAKFRG